MTITHRTKTIRRNPYEEKVSEEKRRAASHNNTTKAEASRFSKGGFFSQSRQTETLSKEG